LATNSTKPTGNDNSADGEEGGRREKELNGRKKERRGEEGRGEMKMA